MAPRQSDRDEDTNEGADVLHLHQYIVAPRARCSLVYRYRQHRFRQPKANVSIMLVE
jgi:hypothetical protein